MLNMHFSYNHAPMIVCVCCTNKYYIPAQVFKKYTLVTGIYMMMYVFHNAQQ